MPLVITLPVVNGDDGLWGDKLNTALAAIVEQINTNTSSDAAKLPAAGGALTGRLDVKTVTQASSDKGLIAGAVPLDLSVANYFIVAINGDTTFSFTNIPVGVTGVVLRLSSAGAHSITWPTGTQWPGGSAPAFTAGGVDVVAFLTDDGGTTWRASLAMKDVR